MIPFQLIAFVIIKSIVIFFRFKQNRQLTCYDSVGLIFTRPKRMFNLYYNPTEATEI